MCRVVTDYPEAERGAFVSHSCDADLLVRAPAAEDAAEVAEVAEALDRFVSWFAPDGDASEESRDRLLYELGEASIPALEDLLWRLKYAPEEPFPPPELSSRSSRAAERPRIDWSNELEMIVHRMKKVAITKRQLDEAAASARPILLDKLERLKNDPLEPIED